MATQEFIDRESSGEEFAEHNRQLNILVRFTLHLYTQAADPDAPRPEILRVIGGRLRQLEDWRAVVHNPLTEAEAEQVLARAFPHEPTTGSAA